MTEQMQFQSDVTRLLDIVTHALYTEREIFLRELISNAADACDRLRYAAISNPKLAAGDADYKVAIELDAPARLLTIRDNGIGMTRDELVKNLGTIAHSGTREVLKNLGDGEKKDVNLIGQFGVGFYAAFMVADHVEVKSLKAGDKTAYVWSSDGKGSYAIDETLKDSRGTEITLHIKDDASEFLLEERLKNVIKKYSDHIGFPITLAGKVVNAAAALWMKPKSDITDQQYTDFYKSVAGQMVMDKPWMTLHWRSEGVIEYNALLFIPEMKPFDLYDPKRHHGVKLYVKRVFIADGVEALLPPFLRFVKGVVDSEDLPLNISREMLQASPVMAKMNSAITRKVLDALEKKAKDDPKAFEDFWALFGAVVKEGLYDAHQHRTQLCKVARFYSSAAEGITSLDDYISRMKEGQDQIYYLSAPSLEAAKNSPQLEAFRARGIEVLFMTDTIDEFWLPIQDSYDGKKFKSVTRGAAHFSNIKSDIEPPKPAASPDADKLAVTLKEILRDEVKDVVISQRLVDSAVCLVAADNEVDMHMQRVLKKSQGYDAALKPVLEINPGHPLMKKLASLAANDAAMQDAALLLLDQARILEGEPLKNPAAFAKRLSAAMERGLI